MLDLHLNGRSSRYSVQGLTSESGEGEASISEVMPGVFSILLASRSFTVNVAAHAAGNDLEVWVNGARHIVSVSDTRDRAGRGKGVTTTGPLEIRAQMPGKVVKLLVEIGTEVHAGQSLVVVEAMKMQNEMKSPKDGVVTKIISGEGATVSAGETLMIVQ
jgi:biotin carboxyl carrier protein